MNTRYTPGPWQIQVTGGSRECVSGATHGLWACIEGHDFETRNANARLIASAPDLLAMLERVTEDAANAYRAIACVNEGIIPTANLVTLDQARALIAHAKGE